MQSGFAEVAAQIADSWRRNRGALLTTLRQAHLDLHQGREFQLLCLEHRLPLSLVPLLVKTFREHRPRIALTLSVRTLLQTLRQDGWRLGILTNGDPGVQRRKIDALGLLPLIDEVVFAEEHGGKPNPAAFLVATQRLRLRPTQCLHVGDDPIGDVAGARAAGLRVIRVLAPPEAGACAPVVERNGRLPEADATVDTVLDVARVAAQVLTESPDVV